MKRLMELVVKLYPVAWRKRYEAEFAALLEDVKPGWRTLVDVLREAVFMQMQSVRLGKSVFLLALTGFVVALVPSYFIADQYSAAAVLKIQPRRAGRSLVTESIISEQMNEWARRVFTRSMLVELIERFRLYPEKQGKAPMEDLVAEMRENIEIRPAAKDTVFIRFRSRDRFLSKRVAEELVNEIVDVSHASDSTGSLFDLGIATPVRMPTFPIYPNRLYIALAGLCIGAVIGVIHAFTRRAVQPRPT